MPPAAAIQFTPFEQAHVCQCFCRFFSMSKHTHRPLAGLTVEQGYAVSADAKPVATANPNEYAATVQIRRQRGKQMRSSQVFQSDDPWAQAVAKASSEAAGYLRPLSQRDRDILVAETTAPVTPAERQQWAERKDRTLNCIFLPFHTPV